MSDKKTGVFSLRVWIEDTDFGGVVYHANYLKFFERARSMWAEEVGWGLAWQQAKGVMFAVRTAELDYRRPARLGELLQVETQITRLGRASIDFSQIIYCLRHHQQQATALCFAKIKIACVQAGMKLCSLPKELHVLLEDYIMK